MHAEIATPNMFSTSVPPPSSSVICGVVHRFIERSIDEESWVYLTLKEDARVYRIKASDHVLALLMETGDRVELTLDPVSTGVQPQVRRLINLSLNGQ